MPHFKKQGGWQENEWSIKILKVEVKHDVYIR